MKRVRRWGITSSILVVITLILVNSLIVLPYYVISPGRALDVEKFLAVPADKAHPPTGRVLLTTVGLLRAHPLDIVWAWVTPGNSIEKKKDVTGHATPQQFLQDNQQEMDDSQQTAIAVAMRRAGYAVTQLGSGALVAGVANDAPATGKLQRGDVIEAVNGRSVQVASDLLNNVRGLAPGTVVQLRLSGPQGSPRDVAVTTAPRPDNQSGVYLGVLVQTKDPRLSTPFPVSFKQTQIIGPSAGLAFSLALLDDLTPGELTGGKKVAVTGTLDITGGVGPVGGARQKAVAVSRSGAKLFIVPSSEADDVRKHAPKGLKVVPVDTLDQAIQVLAQNGGDVTGLPKTAAGGSKAA